MPSSGRSWLRLVIGKVRCIQEGTSDKNIYQIPGYRFKHLFKDWPGKVLFLLRDPRDLMISSYYQYKYRPSKGASVRGTGVGTFSEFIRGSVGISKVLALYNDWYFKHMEFPSRAVYYEDLVADPFGEFSRILDWFEEDYTEEILKEAIEFGGFDNLRKLSKEGYFKSAFLNAVNPDDERTFKFRIGKVGAYKSFIEIDDLKFIEDEMKKLKWARYG